MLTQDRFRDKSPLWGRRWVTCIVTNRKLTDWLR